MQEKISSFEGENRFLSNFYVGAPIAYRGESYATSEHLYQALKTQNPVEREMVRTCSTPGKAKRTGKKVTIRPDWNEVKDSIMRDIIRLKFEQNPAVAEMLIATGNAELIEGNFWGDTEWGVCNGVGQNKLGKLLQALRSKLRRGADG